MGPILLVVLFLVLFGKLKQQDTPRSGERGAALIEIMVAMVILVASVLGLTNSSISAGRASDSSRHATEAATVAYDKLEHLRTLLPTDSQLSSGNHSDPVNPLAPDGNSGGIFTRTWTVTTSLPITAMARIEMRVSWPTQGGARAVTLVSYVLQ